MKTENRIQVWGQEDKQKESMREEVRKNEWPFHQKEA